MFIHLSCWCVLVVTPVKGMRATGNSPFVLLLSHSPHAPFNRLAFGVTLICPAAILSSGTASVLFTCPHVHPLFSLLSFLTSPDRLPRLSSQSFHLRTSFLPVSSSSHLPHAPLFFLTPSFPLTLPLHVSSPAGLS